MVSDHSGGEGLRVTETYYKKANKVSNISVILCSHTVRVSRLPEVCAPRSTATLFTVQHRASQYDSALSCSSFESSGINYNQHGAQIT